MAATASTRRSGASTRARGVGAKRHHQLVDPVRRKRRIEGRGDPDRLLGVDAVDGGLVGLAARPEGDRAGREEGEALEGRGPRAERGNECPVAVLEPLDELVVGDPRIADPGRHLGPAFGDMGGRPPVHPAEVADQVPHLPLGAGRDRRFRAGPGGGCCEELPVGASDIEAGVDLHGAYSAERSRRRRHHGRRGTGQPTRAGRSVARAGSPRAPITSASTRRPVVK